MPKQHQQDKIINELESSNDKFYTKYDNEELHDDENSGRDSDEEDINSDSDIIINKRRTIPLFSLSNSDEQHAENEREDNYGPWEDIAIQDNVPHKIDFTSGDKIDGSKIPGNCKKPIDFLKLFLLKK